MISALKSRLRHRLGPVLRRTGLFGQYHGNVDGVHARAIMGWVLESRSGRGNLPVGLFTPQGMIASTTANVSRDDVTRREGCGFQFPITDALRIEAGDAALSVRVLGAHPHEIGRIELGGATGQPLDPARPELESCRSVLLGDTRALMALLAEVGEIEEPLAPWQPPEMPRHQALFHPAPAHPDHPATGLPGYVDFRLFRDRLDEEFDVAPGLEAADHYLYRYLSGYRAGEGLRVPLAADQITYLNAPAVMAGNRYSLSRMMWWRLMQARRDLLAGLNLNDRDSWIDALFWWAHQDCPALGHADCLVPSRFADALRSVPPSRFADGWPLSHFLIRFHRASPQLHFLKPGTDTGRQLLMLCAMVMAARRPDLLRYIPARSITALLARDASGSSDLERFLRRISGDSALSVPPARYEAAIRSSGYDLQSHRFTSLTAQGHRLEAAALPVPRERPLVDVQLIGPLAKSSGLGQATRLSAQILRETGLSVRGVDFGLDNPAPEGFSSATEIEDYGPARINLIHLNAETVPLAFAYQPDIFQGAYNIGYFYWEVDRPAWCHFLGMALLDEIWVSTDYGVQIYQRDAAPRPISNVGMSYEDPGEIDRRDARDFVNQRMMLNDGHYICLVAFDSFSFVQRKNPLGVLQAFQQAFAGVENARLIVKTQNRDNISDDHQAKIWDRAEALMANDPRIMVMNETLPYRDVLRLLKGSDCYISLHRSEGLGFGMMEAMNLSVPVVATAYSGNMDFCTADTTWLVDYTEVEMKPSDYIFVRPGSRWAEPDIAHAAVQLRAAYDDPGTRAARAEAGRAHIRQNFSTQAIAARYGARLRQILAGLNG